MKRAAILIGVHKVEKLPKLHAVLDGVKRMEEWALAQGMDRELVQTITDEDGGRVTGDDIQLAVMKSLKTDGLKQLIIYFAGHGVNIGYQEYWLLTHALEFANHSVNLAGSVARAMNSGGKHIVLLSDCCRTAPQTIQGLGAEGTIIFPNPVAGAERSHVDVFYATRLGEPSLEIKNADEAADMFRAVYTDTMLDALNGMYEDICEDDDTLGVKVVRPWPLSKRLLKAVPIRVHERTNSLLTTQVPDSQITSDPTESWISDISKAKKKRTASFTGSSESRRAASFAVADVDATDSLLRAAIENENLDLATSLETLRSPITRSGPTTGSGPSETNKLADAAEQNATAFGPFEFGSQCGFKFRGAKISEAICNNDTQIHDNGTAVEVNAHDGPISILLVFESGYGALMPALPEFIGSLTLEEHNLSDVAYEPSKNSWRWSEFESREKEIRQLRAVVAASSKRGVFRLQGEGADKLSRRMQLAKGIDPSLALCAAHAYANQGNDKWLQQMAMYLRSDLNKVPLDIAVLAGQVRSENTANIDWTVPFLPMLSQTWAFLPAYEVELPEGLETIHRHLAASSLWSLYTPDGVKLIREAINKGELK